MPRYLMKGVKPTVYINHLMGEKPPLAWVKSAAREYKRLHPDADLHECVGAGLARAYDDLLDHLRAKL